MGLAPTEIRYSARAVSTGSTRKYAAGPVEPHDLESGYWDAAVRHFHFDDAYEIRKLVEVRGKLAAEAERVARRSAVGLI